ncbi:hypothetical protein [Ferrimonas lipolytica]|uniref:Uncharacterized protein n=1 Tax=Ferrimonas lipolytica TaxID=2724191 RepID=A0A6H1UCX1_9GAMM|nr:hypothetical protein [Ferrimonas lipolytica]QIZ75652.1 hypothetical protein HER31_01280 [Ferrimonas lipolytica]
MTNKPLCSRCQQQLHNQPHQPHIDLVEFANHEASTVDGGFSEHEYHCNSCGNDLRYISGIIMEGGWSEMR